MSRARAKGDGMALADLVRPDEHVLGIGIDTAVVAAISDAASQFGSAYLRRVCSTAEVSTLPRTVTERDERLAVLWAAKEAATKALAPSPDEPWPWPALDIDLDAGSVALSRGPARVAEAAGVGRVAVQRVAMSGAGGRPVVTVVALALGRPPTDRRRTP